MKQISQRIYCDDFVESCYMESRRFPNPYLETPYLVIPDFLDAERCQSIAKKTFAASDAKRAMLKTTILDGVVDPTVDEAIRKTHIYTLDDDDAEAYREAFVRHQSIIENYFHAALTTATDVQVLEYETGFFYKKHADDSNEIIDQEGNTVGFNLIAPQRKVTTVLFATAHDDAPASPHSFSGGELLFNYLSDASGAIVTLRPKAGDMVVFLSNPVFSHEVCPVTGGYRLSLVQWHNALMH